jgi:hypothetical protein
VRERGRGPNTRLMPRRDRKIAQEMQAARERKWGRGGKRRACIHANVTLTCVCVCVCARAGKREYLQAVKRRIDLNPKP